MAVLNRDQIVAIQSNFNLQALGLEATLNDGLIHADAQQNWVDISGGSAALVDMAIALITNLLAALDDIDARLTKAGF